MIQAIGPGLAGASAWDLDDAMHVGGQYGAESLKRWGFWNSLAGQDGYPASDLALLPWHYAWSVLSRAFPAGSGALVVPRTGVPGLRATAARISDGSGFDLSLAVVNDSDTPRSITLTVPSVPGIETLARYDYFSGQQTVDANGFAVPDETVAARLSAGVPVSLPSRGLVLLTSLGFGAPVALGQGRRPLLDDLHDWRQTDARTRGLKLDQGNVAQFNYASSRVMVSPLRRPTPSRAAGKEEVQAQAGAATVPSHRSSQVTSFGIKAYGPSLPQVSVYGSEDGSVWAPIALASTNPAPAVGGRQLLSELLPAGSLPAGVNRVKVVLGRGTELAQVAIMGGRSGPACLAGAPAARANSLAGFRPGTSPAGVLGSIGPPGARSRFVWSYCVVGGGQLAVVFPRRGSASLIATTTARGYRLSGIGPGASLPSLQNRYGRAVLRAVGRRLLVTPTGDVFVVRFGHVTAVGLVGRSVLSKPGALCGDQAGRAWMTVGSSRTPAVPVEPSAMSTRARGRP
jgi:hypothetical protein